MGIDLALQCLHARLQQKALVLAQLELKPGSVKNLQRNRNHGDSGGINGSQEAKGRLTRDFLGKLEIKNLSRKMLSYFHAGKQQRDDEEKEAHLPIQVRTANHLADPTVDTEINEGRERPYLFRVTGQIAQDTGQYPHADVERQGEIFVVHHTGK